MASTLGLFCICFGVFILGFIRETRFGHRYIEFAVPIAALIMFHLTQSMRITAPWYSELIFCGLFFWCSFAFYLFGRHVRLVFREGPLHWWNKHVRYLTGFAFFWIPFFALMIAVGDDSKTAPPHFQSAKAPWTCSEEGMKAPDAGEWAFCQHDQPKRDAVRQHYEAAVESYRKGNYEPCLRHLNEVYSVTWRYENSKDLQKACRQGLAQLMNKVDDTYAYARDYIPTPKAIPSEMERAPSSSR